MSLPQPSRGEVWSVNFDPTKGREQAGTRPALVLSVDKFDDIRSVSKQRFHQFYGTLSAQTMAEVEKRVRILLNL